MGTARGVVVVVHLRCIILPPPPPFESRTRPVKARSRVFNVTAILNRDMDESSSSSGIDQKVAKSGKVFSDDQARIGDLAAVSRSRLCKSVCNQRKKKMAAACTLLLRLLATSVLEKEQLEKLMCVTLSIYPSRGH